MKNRLFTLDALKFFGSIIIVFHHFQQMSGIRFRLINFFGGEFYFGYIVELFFVLSGFFMGMKIEKNQKSSFGVFFGMKAKRLVTMASMSVITYCILYWLYQALFHEYWADGSLIGIWSAFASVCMMHQGGALNIGLGANNVVWYIDVLLICYVLYWLVLWIAKRLGVTPYYMFVFCILMGLGIVQYGISLPFCNATVARGYYSFFWGIILHWLIENVSEKYLNTLSFFVIVGFVVILITDVEKVIVIDNIAMICVFMLYLAIIIIFLKSKIINKVFNHSFFGELGAVSYEIYLWHVPFFLLADLVRRVISIENSLSWKTMIMYTVIICVGATIIHYKVEKRIT